MHALPEWARKKRFKSRDINTHIFTKGSKTFTYSV
jgi:hypothetical protein